MSVERALIVAQPWLDLILSGAKTWEMRSRKTNIRGRVGLIEKGTGMIVGEVSIVDSFKASFMVLASNVHKHQVDDFSLLKKWNVAWELKEPKRFSTPIPYDHPKGAVVWVKV